MPDLVVTVSRDRWRAWVEGGADAAPRRLSLGKSPKDPPIAPAERVYVAAFDRIRCFAPLAKVELMAWGWELIPSGAPIPCTIADAVRGFPLWKERWWKRDAERPFPGWRREGVPPELQPPEVAATPADEPVEFVDEPLDDRPPEDDAEGPAAPKTGESSDRLAKRVRAALKGIPPVEARVEAAALDAALHARDKLAAVSAVLMRVEGILLRIEIARGYITTGHGQRIKIDPGPFRSFDAATCVVCAASARRGEKAPSLHTHRVEIPCPYCDAPKVFPRGQGAGNEPSSTDLFCMGCGRWWDRRYPPPGV